MIIVDFCMSWAIVTKFLTVEKILAQDISSQTCD